MTQNSEKPCAYDNSFIVKDPTQEPNERDTQGSVGLRAGQSSMPPALCPPSTGLCSPTPRLLNPVVWSLFGGNSLCPIQKNPQTYSHCSRDQKSETRFPGLKSKCWQAWFLQGALKKYCFPCDGLVTGGCLHLLAHCPFFHAESQQGSIFSPL